MSLLARLEAIRNFRLHLPTLPVIDTAPSDTNDALPGLRFLRDELKRDCDFLRQNANSSTNAPYLIAVWDELVHARQPVALYRTFSSADKSRTVKVDVVAENGARWVRINTIKNARLMMEFRELDSYLTSDDDESRSRLAQSEFDNAVLRMGRELLVIAKANPISIPGLSSTVNAPRVTIRLTRLDPLSDDAPDPRIAKTIQCLCDMGVDVQLGERAHADPVPIPKIPPTRKPLEPTTNINLDLSALIALISDISHSHLPRTEQEAHTRFKPPQSYLDWKKDRVKSLARQNWRTHDVMGGVQDDEDGEGTRENSGQHSRALAAQAIQEMSKGILEEIREHVSAIAPDVTFWTTSEARHRCLQIVSKIGGERERLRADALLGSTLCTRAPPLPTPAVASMSGTLPIADAYWEHSRYPAGFLPLASICIYPSTLPSVQDGFPGSTTFFDSLAQTCTGILSHDATSVSEGSFFMLTGEDVLEEIPPAAQTSLPKLTVHTVRSMLAGASRGYTTLTTNRSSVKAVLKEMRRVCGRGGYNDPESMTVPEKAVLWILDPRSLSEGMRSE